MDMRVRHTIFMMVVCVCVPCAAEQGTKVADASDSMPSKGAIIQMPLLNALLDMGRSADCYFTVELTQAQAPSRSLEATMIRYTDLPKTVDEAIELLRGQLPGMTVRRSKTNAVVVQVIEDAAKNLPGYWLDRKVSLSFSGMLGDVFDPLQKVLGSKLEFVHGGVQGTLVSGMLDYETRIDIKQVDVPVRDCLTDSMPLSSYRRILWKATTSEKSPRPVVNLAFGGNVESGTQNVSASPISFDVGEKAFRENRRTDALATAADKFVEDGLKSKKPHQVRWAMLYLGKHGFAEYAPLLVRSIDYQYTSCQVLKESYPAVRAVSMMGAPGVLAATTEMPKAESKLQVELLCHAVLLAEGLKGVETLQATADACQSAERAAEIKAAVASLLKTQHYAEKPQGLSPRPSTRPVETP